MLTKLGGMLFGFLIVASMVYLMSHIMAFFIRDHLPWW